MGLTPEMVVGFDHVRYIYICLYRKEIPEAYAKEQAFNRNKLRPFDFVNVYTSGDFRRYTIIQRYTG